MAYNKRSPKLVAIINAHNLGSALLDGSNGPIGNALELTLDALYDAQDTDVTDSEASRLDRFLNELDACCDPNSGYFINEPRAYEMENRVVQVLADITERAIKQPKAG